MKYRKILLILAIATFSLTACKKEENPVPETTAMEETTTTEEIPPVEETVKAITKEQFITLYENTKSIYTENPELFTENAEISSIIDLPEITDAEIPVSEAITFKEAMQILQEDNIPEEILEEVEKGIISSETRWDDGLTHAEAIEMLVNTLQKETGIAEFNFKQGKVSGHEVDLTDKSLESDTDTGVDITGADYTGEATNDEYDERIHGEEAQKEQDKKRQEAIDEIEGSDEYKELLAEIIASRINNDPIEVDPPPGWELDYSGDANPNEGPQYGQTTDPELAGGSLY